MTTAYLDASAFVKLVVVEPQTEALRLFLRDWPRQSSCSLLRTEALRAVRNLSPDKIENTRVALLEPTLIALDHGLLDRAGMLDPSVMRCLDAIHLAAALSLGDELGVVVTYDERMKAGAELLGLPVASPA